MTSLIQKYNVPGPRYTSYPTVPFWDEATFSERAWVGELRRAFSATNSTTGISLYLHLPYCESMCAFCGCTKRITCIHGVEVTYIDALLAKWNLYCDLLAQNGRENRHLTGLHLGAARRVFLLLPSLNGYYGASLSGPHRLNRPTTVGKGTQTTPLLNTCKRGMTSAFGG